MCLLDFFLGIRDCGGPLKLHSPFWDVETLILFKEEKHGLLKLHVPFAGSGVGKKSKSILIEAKK